ncbi:unnamed protein product [Cylindrotheca closterium]|uniref:Uncharacterized protein n=1 Tax=Cylindrotheca closterium TaxID=2856 RepID=A0AAD2G5J4_9STRA|nr:unnamed protein product [Cylindrotheca closterium]
MSLQGILGRTETISKRKRKRKRQINDLNDSKRSSSRIRSLIPIQYVILGFAFSVALYVNAIEEQQLALQDLLIRNDSNTRQQSKKEVSDDDVSGTSMTESTILSDDDASSTMTNAHADGSNQSSDSSANKTTTIGWVVTITGCGHDAIMDGAAVLKHSIHLNSIQAGANKFRYDYKMYAIYHPEGEACALPLKDLGYKLIRRETPVATQEIEGKFLRKKIESNGCCGAKELIKLEAYTLIDHQVVVLLDLDVIVLKPMDALFDLMLDEASPSSSDHLSNTNSTTNVPIMWQDKPIPDKVNAFFTRDYHLVAPEKPYKPVQGGFLVLRPDMAVYQEFLSIIKKGIQKPGGWGGLVGPFYGFMTIQGIIPYYYDVLHKNEAIELNRCIYNQMMDNPRDNSANDNPQDKCRTNQQECEECRTRPMGDIVSAHFTFCPKPWNCFPNDVDTIELRLCRKLHHEWFRIRSDLEESWGRDPIGTGTFQEEHFFGFCSDHGKTGYTSIAQPYGRLVPGSTSESTDEEETDEDENRGEDSKGTSEDDENGKDEPVES